MVGWEDLSWWSGGKVDWRWRNGRAVEVEVGVVLRQNEKQVLVGSLLWQANGTFLISALLLGSFSWLATSSKVLLLYMTLVW